MAGCEAAFAPSRLLLCGYKYHYAYCSDMLRLLPKECLQGGATPNDFASSIYNFEHFSVLWLDVDVIVAVVGGLAS